MSSPSSDQADCPSNACARGLYQMPCEPKHPVLERRKAGVVIARLAWLTRSARIPSPLWGRRRGGRRTGAIRRPILIDENAITQALGAVHGPDGRTPLTQSGAIGGLTHRDGKVYLSIVVDPAQAGKAEPMRKAAESALRGVAGVTAAIVTLTSERAPGAPPAHAHSH